MFSLIHNHNIGNMEIWYCADLDITMLKENYKDPLICESSPIKHKIYPLNAIQIYKSENIIVYMKIKTKMVS